VRSRTTCVFDLRSDETRQKALKRKYAELQEKSKMEGELISLLRTMAQREGDTVLQRLRAGEEVESIVKLVRDSAPAYSAL
jgi:hypothetical protein